MASTSVINRVEELRHQSHRRMAQIQYETCPMVRNINMYHTYEYWYDGYRYNVWETDVSVYRINNVPYCYDNDLRNTVFMDTLDNLVAEEKVWPFILFVGGCAVKWSDITIIHDYTYSYIRLDNFDRASRDDVIYANMVYFPVRYKNIRYGEDNDILLDPNAKGFYFNSDGYHIIDPSFTEVGIRLEILDDDIYYKKMAIDDTVDDISFDLEGPYVISTKNIILFDKDNKFVNAASARFYDDYYGAYSMFKVNHDYPDYNYAIFVFNKDIATENNARYIYSRAEDFYKDGIKSLITSANKRANSEEWARRIAPLIEMFDFDYSLSSTYDENIENSIKYITEYDYRLWKDAVLDGCTIKSFTYTGKEIKALADNKGYAHFSRKHSDLIEDVIMMFVNNKLYDYMIDVSYSKNTINIPVFGIFDDDHVEILMFTECNNNILDIRVTMDANDKVVPVYIHPEYDLDKCYIMCEDCIDPSYTVPESLEGRRQYICEVSSYTVDDNSKYTINFKDDYYSHINEEGELEEKYALKIVPKKQFRYYRFKHKEGQYKIILPTSFNYCHDADRYMVFVNGRKIDRTEYTITIMNKFRPFDKLVLYVSTILEAGDYIDIFYLPEEFTESFTEETMTTSGYVYLSETDNYPRLYPLSKYTNILFINGYKVNPLDIKDVDMNALIVNTKPYLYNENGSIRVGLDREPLVNPAAIKSVNNVTVLEYLKGDPLDPDNPARDSWKNYINTITNNPEYAGDDGYKTIKLIFGDLYKIENPEADFKSYFASLRAILYDVIVDYYLTRAEATTGSQFVMEFERKYWEPYIDEPTGGTRIRIYPESEKVDFSDTSPNKNYVEENLEKATFLDQYINADDTNEKLVMTAISMDETVKIIPLFPDHDKLLDYYPTDSIYANPEDVLSGNVYVSEDQSSISNIGFVVMNSNDVNNTGRTAIGVLKSTITIPDNTFEAVSGKKFSHWNTLADGTGTTFNVGDTYVLTADLVLYAIWVDE